MGYPKYTWAYVEGKPITKDQAAMLILRLGVDAFYCEDPNNERDMEIMGAVGLTLFPGFASRSSSSWLTAQHKALSALGCFDHDDHDVEYFCTSPLISSGEEGGSWLGWDGSIGGHFYLGKYVDSEKLFYELSYITKKVPTIDMVVQTFTLHEDKPTYPISELRVSNGSIQEVKPDRVQRVYKPTRRAVCTIDQLRQAVSLCRST